MANAAVQHPVLDIRAVMCLKATWLSQLLTLLFLFCFI